MPEKLRVGIDIEIDRRFAYSLWWVVLVAIADDQSEVPTGRRLPLNGTRLLIKAQSEFRRNLDFDQAIFRFRGSAFQRFSEVFRLAAID